MPNKPAEEKPIITLVNNLFSQAAAQNASDIHIEPNFPGAVVKLRVNGELNFVQDLTADEAALIAKRIKVIGKLNVDVSHVPQDGRVAIRVAGRDYDARLAISPVMGGERVVIRLLDTSRVAPSWDRFGFLPKDLKAWQDLCALPYGLLIINGPPGSGKTSLTYSSLASINCDEINVITIEDPVECQLPGISQIEVKNKFGLTQYEGLKAALRQDPDVIMLDSLRESKVASLALRAATTGHLVVATTDEPSSSQAVAKLLAGDNDPHQVVTTLQGVITSRLVRRLCPDCRVPHALSPAERASLGVPDKGSSVQFAKAGPGCESCHHTGYRGRTMVYDLAVMNGETRLALLPLKDPVEVGRAMNDCPGTRMGTMLSLRAREGEIDTEDALQMLQALS